MAEHQNGEVIRRFYEAFNRRDAELMSTCYHPEVTFADPAFPHLKGNDASDMWRMLCEAAKDLRIELRACSADEHTGRANWVAFYTFGKTGRRVVNNIQASFRFKDGRIIEHTDAFDFPKWTRMALGLAGYALGWTPFMRRKVQSQAARNLASWQKRRTSRT
jgi:ketosteroid isomerase-like protein